MNDHAPVQLNLPLAPERIPEPLRKLCAADSPAAMRGMAARGAVPIKGADLVFVLVQLTHDADAAIAQSAKETLSQIPYGVLEASIETLQDPEILDYLARDFSEKSLYWYAIAINPNIDDTTLSYIAGVADEKLCERIALNEERLITSPELVAALYKNPAMRMSTADRIVELATRHGLTIPGVAAFALHAEAIAGQEIPPPTDEPLVSDLVFQQTLAMDEDDPNAIELDPVDHEETLKEKHKPLAAQIADMNIAGKVRLATVGNGAARAILVRDFNKLVAQAAIASPRATEHDALAVAKSRQIGVEVLRYIGMRRDWLRNYELKRALVFNPKTPIGISLSFLSHMSPNDLKVMARSKNIAAPIKKAATQHLTKRESRN